MCEESQFLRLYRHVILSEAKDLFQANHGSTPVLSGRDPSVALLPQDDVLGGFTVAAPRCELEVVLHDPSLLKDQAQ
jgi:hypothetical protein